ncbi:CKLF-like MARVEL transmembrane domain-containing protein 6 [Sphaerodactylus townsendi]|uniref:CKLF-like MARVEL transmembrane domain-containing protein 6 n=1 Tax=Sphaerodactylus townsendi TaxID=933632 RepID=UPI0020269853|nr:CKLF-like MARVEL transmembrane domain-containing protein 6 [Sphaerodactylus townsendi]
MENGGRVYEETTSPAESSPQKGLRNCGCTAAHLERPRLVLKALQLVLSFLAFVLEEVIEVCTNCSGLYFFEFVSCSAFLLCIPILAMYCTPLYEKVEKRQVKNLDFGIVSLVGLFFWIASIVFSSTYDKTPIEIAAVTFGYFASIAFTVDFVMILYKRCHARKETPPENTARLPNLAENQPLNNPPA